MASARVFDCDSPPNMMSVLLISSYPIDASLRGGGGEPRRRFVRFIHCRGGIGVFVDMDWERTVEEHKISESRNQDIDSWQGGQEIII